jgi:hypothetical protein
MANVKTGEVQYDQRLFNQDQGLGSGFAADDAYGVYDKALFADRRCARVSCAFCGFEGGWICQERTACVATFCLEPKMHACKVRLLDFLQ